MAMINWWDVLPDSERQQWSLDPFVAVGPLRFGVSPDEVSMALSSITTESQRHTLHQPALDAVSMVVEGSYPKFGLKLYYREERLAAVVVDALHGPQVVADDMPLVGRVPSTLEQWMIDRAEGREPHGELTYLDAGVPGSEALGVVIDVQRAGDHLLTRPVFVPLEAMDDLSHWLPREAWSLC
ncbi:hypothetical protein FNV62_01000 [Streptomyces sp. RLB3-17]|uniref:hypothetical protein n=1 Tax=unclassified Streptomyces TaxID=2593676 RepID=UPI00116330B4|nr:MULTISPECIES: hypothetical protein [unclassified Streptomyces]QDN95151.1 hypothetical protein FNV58_02455 [Streptomyces sp. RLB1-9]QDO16875.1 hypothetical protein FNV65_01025 [Streptomyces sp. S1A1-8]QDO26998.1 hypothetical protein FNV63_01020 [Streptomyces sp. S1A1-3]QDO37037.1 hypothetical protein FNV62_01000 [Streptomyces sp. RLB3-17]